MLPFLIAKNLHSGLVENISKPFLWSDVCLRQDLMAFDTVCRKEGIYIWSGIEFTYMAGWHDSLICLIQPMILVLRKSQCQLLSCWMWSFVRIKPRMIFWLKLIMSINFSCHGLNLCINQPIYKIKSEWALHINVIFPLNWKDILSLYLGTSELYGSHIKDYGKPNLSLKKLEIL